MIQLDIVKGRKAGTRWVARRFPVRIGREKGADISLTDDGVWDSHLELTVRTGEGCFLTGSKETLTLLNGKELAGPVRLRNGDVIEAGTAALRFSLSPTQPPWALWRDVAVWIAIALLCLGQIALISFVLP